MSLLIVLIVLGTILLYLLFMKLVLCIDTANNEYYLQAKGLVKAKIEAHETELIQIKCNMFFFNFNFYPLRKSRKKMKKPKSKKIIPHKSRRIGLKKIIRIANTFKIDELIVDVDTGNCITNAKLFPPFALMNGYGGHFRVNFEGRNQLLLRVQNQPIRIIKSFINF